MTVILPSLNVKPAARAALLVALGLGGIVAVVVAMLGPTKIVGVEVETFDPGQISDTPLVVARHTSGGFDIFGIQFDAPDRWVSVGVAPSEDCLFVEQDGTEFLDGGGSCESYAGLAGPVRGGGTRADGTRWVEMWLDVDRVCFEASTVGHVWPAPGCASG